jgi:hypothetical protein
MCVSTSLEAQTSMTSLDYYINVAMKNSPLMLDERNQSTIINDEKQYLKNAYTHLQTLLSGSYLFVPIVENSKGTTSFKWNAQSANDYYGYDLGVSNGNLQCGVTFTKPLLGNGVYKVAESQMNVQHDILMNNIRINKHDIARDVTDQYILCLLDKSQMNLADSISSILATQSLFITKLGYAGIAKQSDVQLIRIEQQSNDELMLSYRQSYHQHLMELNALCCIRDTSTHDIDDIDIQKTGYSSSSQFLVKYDLDSVNAVVTQRMYETKYKPQLNLFTNFGLQATHYDTMYKNLGFSVGLTFSMVLSDGKLKKIKQHETNAILSSIDIYRNNLKVQNEIRCNKCSAAIKDYDTRIKVLNTQLKEYHNLLEMSQKEIKTGLMSVFDYITTLKNIISAEQQKMITEANRRLAINAYNYYNW